VCLAFGKVLLDNQEYDKAIPVLKFGAECSQKELTLLTYLCVEQLLRRRSLLTNRLILMRWDCYIVRALAFVGAERYDEALETIKKQLEEEPQKCDLYILRAKLYQHLGNVCFACNTDCALDRSDIHRTLCLGQKLLRQSEGCRKHFPPASGNHQSKQIHERDGDWLYQRG
jgi:tetratricopeptide (TPR) repeat protein